MKCTQCGGYKFRIRNAHDLYCAKCGTYIGDIINDDRTLEESVLETEKGYWFKDERCDLRIFLKSALVEEYDRLTSKLEKLYDAEENPEDKENIRWYLNEYYMARHQVENAMA